MTLKKEINRKIETNVLRMLPLKWNSFCGIPTLLSPRAQHSSQSLKHCMTQLDEYYYSSFKVVFFTIP
jgi:hypothetical protein